jgi:hypothetical protein
VKTRVKAEVAQMEAEMKAEQMHPLWLESMNPPPIYHTPPSKREPKRPLPHKRESKD